MIGNRKGAFEIERDTLAQNCAGLTYEQLRAVTETKNVVVCAGAGSGKTTVLAARFAYLVEAKNVPAERILALTFTKKAATEMKARIFSGLRNHLNGKDLRGRNAIDTAQPHFAEIQERAGKAIGQFGTAHVQTLDSYFSEVARKGARFYGIRPDFILDDEKIHSVVSYRATKYVLEHLDDDEMKTAAQMFGIQNVAERLFAQPVLRYATVITPVDFEKSISVQRSVLREKYEDAARAAAGLVEDFAASIPPVTPRTSASAKKLYGYAAENCRAAVPQFSPDCLERADPSFMYEFLDMLCGYCSTAFSHVSDRSYKSLKKSLLSLIEVLSSVANYISGSAVQKKLFAHLEQFQSEVNETKRALGILSFTDVAQLALETLSARKEIRAVERNKFDAIMIDEFQDDNSLQCAVLLMLADGNEVYGADGTYLPPELFSPELNARLDPEKLFFVGDDKQSIYRFRGADVSVFRNVRAAIGNTVRLSTNFRSEPELICGFNSIFGGYSYPDGTETDEPAVFMTERAFPPLLDRARTPRIPSYEAAYERAEIPEHKAGCFSGKRITVALCGGAKSSSGGTEDAAAEYGLYQREARYVAAKIRQLVSSGECRYRDIALLFRTATPTPAYESVLLQNGIPYSTEVYKGFFSDGPVNDIISLLKLCVYPQDKNSFARVLRSPFGNCTFAEMETVLLNSAEPFVEPFPPELLERPAIRENPPLARKIQLLKSLYGDVRTRLATEKLTKTISFIWYGLGYRYETLWNEQVAMYGSLYDILFELARQSEEKACSLAAFIDLVKSYEDNDSKLEGLDVVLEAEDAVQIMTVHKSKGLEFKVVFVCAASSVSQQNSSRIGFDRLQSGFVLKMPGERALRNILAKLPGENARQCADNSYFSLMLQKNGERHECAELRRLLYVAFTRAEKLLFVVGSIKSGLSDADGKAGRFRVHPEGETSFTAYTEKGAEKSVDYELPRSFVQILMPVLVGYAPGRSPFVLEMPEEAASDVSSPKPEPPCTKGSFVRTLEDFESTVRVIRPELSPVVYLSPSALPPEPAGRAGTFRAASPDYELINKIVASTVPGYGTDIPSLEDCGEESERSCGDGVPEPLFRFSQFGTAAHSYLEAKVRGAKENIPPGIWTGMNEKWIPGVGMEGWDGRTNREKKISRIRSLCADMAERFARSTLFAEAASAPWLRTEHPFRSRVQYADSSARERSVIMSGKIDLVFGNGSKSSPMYTIVDYKTNQTVVPSLYYNQLACYRAAVSQMLGCDEKAIRCVLYYLRFALPVDITEFCTGESLKKSVGELAASTAEPPVLG